MSDVFKRASRGMRGLAMRKDHLLARGYSMADVMELERQAMCMSVETGRHMLDAFEIVTKRTEAR